MFTDLNHVSEMFDALAGCQTTNGFVGDGLNITKPNLESRMTEWGRANPERMRALRAAYRERNREQIREASREHMRKVRSTENRD